MNDRVTNIIKMLDKLSTYDASTSGIITALMALPLISPNDQQKVIRACLELHRTEVVLDFLRMITDDFSLVEEGEKKGQELKLAMVEALAACLNRLMVNRTAFVDATKVYFPHKEEK